MDSEQKNKNVITTPAEHAALKQAADRALGDGAHRRRQRVLLGLAIVIMAATAFVLWNQQRGPSAELQLADKRPLLKKPGNEFQDANVGLRFTPPRQWSMQTLASVVPEENANERLIVKYKRLLPGTATAWLRVHIVDAKPGVSMEDSIRTRSPGAEWKGRNIVETTTVSGLPAAKAQYNAKYNGYPSQRDVIGVLRGDQIFYFILTYRLTDRLAQEELQQAMTTVLLDTK